MLTFDKDKFQEYLNSSGYKDSYLAKQIGISKTAFSRRKNGLVEWTYPEMVSLAPILGVRDPKQTFFSEKVS